MAKKDKTKQPPNGNGITARPPQQIFKSTQMRAVNIYAVVLEYYEAGNQRRMYKNVWRTIIAPHYGISYRTFARYLKIAKQSLQQRERG